MTADPPDDGTELLAAGAEAYSRGSVAEAKRIFEDAARTTTGTIRLGAIVNAASMADELGDHAGSLALYREALAAMPPDAPRLRPTTLVNMSQALQHLGEFDQAQAALEQARALLADDTEQGELRVACLISLTAVAMHRQDWAYGGELASESLDAALRFAPHLAGHPLMNLAATSFETGRRELAVDFAHQALRAFQEAGDHNAVAETQQNLAILLARAERYDEAESPLRTSQTYFERAGLGYRAGVGLKTLGFLAEGRGNLTEARELYRRGLRYFLDSGAAVDIADVRIRLSTVAFRTGRAEECETLLGEAFDIYAAHGLGMHCAQLDFWHASLLADAAAAAPTVELLTRAVRLAVPAALAIDAVRYTLPNGNQREQWNREIADPALRVAFRLAYLSGDGILLSDLIETLCAGTMLHIESSKAPEVRQLPLALPEPPEPDRPDTAALRLGTALAEVAASAGLPVAPPPRLALDGRIALAPYIAAAEARYGRVIRDERTLTL